LNYIDLFHGIGGFALGAYWAGMKFENHFCSDIEPYAQNLYKLRFPESIQLGDITKINTEVLKQYGTEWIITGGFPCQDISIAGKGAGITGARSGLWFEYWRIIRDLRPRFAIMENVGALTFRGLDAVLGSLSEIGYNAEWQDIRASDMGAPHKRERIWIVAYSEQMRQQYCEHEGWPRCQEGIFEGNCQDVADTGLQRQTEHEEQTAVGWWSTEPAVGRLVNGLSGRVDRLKGLGNSIVPQIAELLFNQIKSVATSEPRMAS
jgi:DNA (cytosine-5)-methyltransferase 1